jgi:hypothetical protein
MKWVLALAVLVLTVKLIVWKVAMTELHDDAMLEPSLSQQHAVSPEDVNQAMLKVMMDRGCTFVPGSMHIKVGPTEAVPLNLAAGAMKVQAPGNTQRIDIAFHCRRAGPFFFEKEAVVEVTTRARGDGAGGVYPALPQDEHPH